MMQNYFCSLIATTISILHNEFTNNNVNNDDTTKKLLSTSLANTTRHYCSNIPWYDDAYDYVCRYQCDQIGLLLKS